MISLSRRSFLGGVVGIGAWLAGRLTLAGEAVRTPVALQDITLLDARSGKGLKLVSEIMGDKVVALNFIFTSCSMTCPLQSMALSKAQELLGLRMGHDVVFVSISLDPHTDTPARLTAFADAHKAGSAWRFFTGDARLIADLRKGFEAYDPRRDEHPPFIAIGRAQSPDWSRLYGLPDPTIIASEINAWLA